MLIPYAATHQDRFDLSITLIFFLLKDALSILKANIASFNFLSKLISLVDSKKFFATCCVIVDAPSKSF